MEPETDHVSESVPAPVSRRDFLRRAGKEAAQTGVQVGSVLIPGAGLARTILTGQSAPTAPDATATENTPTDARTVAAQAANSLPWVRALARWRSRATTPTTPKDTPPDA